MRASVHFCLFTLHVCCLAYSTHQYPPKVFIFSFLLFLLLSTIFDFISFSFLVQVFVTKSIKQHYISTRTSNIISEQKNIYIKNWKIFKKDFYFFTSVFIEFTLKVRFFFDSLLCFCLLLPLLPLLFSYLFFYKFLSSSFFCRGLFFFIQS